MSDGKRFADFLTQSTTPYQFVTYARPLLVEQGYVEIIEGNFPSELPNRAFWVRDGKALIAFDIGGIESSVIVAAHNDSPLIKLKKKDNIVNKNVSLAVNGSYAGGLSYTWYGRDLKVAGALFVKEKNDIVMKVVETKKPIATIPFPSTSVYQNSNRGLIFSTNRDTNLTPIIGMLPNTKTVIDYICSEYNIDPLSVVSFDLSFVDSRPATVNGDLICSGRLDDLSSSYACLHGFLESKSINTINILAIFDSEEIGSKTRTGALGNCIDITYEYICKCKGIDYLALKANTLFLSCDSAHCQHPNYEGESKSQLPIGTGVALKTTAKSSYASDDKGLILVTEAAKRANVPYIITRPKNGPSGGGTIGPKVEKLLGVATLDIGPGNYAMHSCRELMSWKDAEAELKLISYLLNNFEELRKYACCE
ncbi:Clan MH, family M18, aspartyl aminopeptidase-like metallopeptidase [Histomonas meleagridis]|uniref:Clan MH, family M18, aspartyl aminopeptidase-like metallopeptidase n=1 Tax=Histomonas meleagridis TaxID=135588 RepID=UPI00355AC4DE|nr:Clan MH, family M18, aspartyl aminopeptidase-like metallopeptidase [Histomonas meleagridis]KAH0801456.1 Clan MH, family M18, aspartyl aminopeptidase-like metallopeptidase [Histomonas meleagridis]